MCSRLPYVLLRVHFFLFSVLCSSIVGTGVVRPADMLGSEVSGIHLRNYSHLGWDAAHVYTKGRPEFRMIILPLISELQGILGFNFQHRTP